jgi:aminoglycoside phosphotransferase (APT) family kinase protein
VPARLLRRWESALEDVAVWRFRPTVVHGDLTVENVLTKEGAISGVIGWGETKVADPADDLAWLMVAAPHDAVESVLEGYQLRRTELLDPHLTDRAYLAGELALARWLLYGVRSNNHAVIADAVEMLRDLDDSTADAQAFADAQALLDAPGATGSPTDPDRARSFT